MVPRRRPSETRFWAGCHAELSPRCLSQEAGPQVGGRPSRLTPGRLPGSSLTPPRPRLRLPPSPRPEITSLVPHV